jgi:hypothetical protein
VLNFVASTSIWKKGYPLIDKRLIMPGFSAVLSLITPDNVCLLFVSCFGWFHKSFVHVLCNAFIEDVTILAVHKLQALSEGLFETFISLNGIK